MRAFNAAMASSIGAAASMSWAESAARAANGATTITTAKTRRTLPARVII